MSVQNHIKNKTVIVGMSGGVDSSVAAALLTEQGYHVIGITMKTYDYMEVGGVRRQEGNCCDLNAVLDARAVADKLKIPHFVVNYRDEFDKVVIKNFVDEYMDGRTPNPCVLCNREIKWGMMLQKAEELGAQFIATGHYARVRFDESRKRYVLSRGKYSEKDQSYALWAVRQEALARTLFPLGEMKKEEVRLFAERAQLATARKKESFEICFIPDDSYKRFLAERIPGLKEKVSGGNIVRDKTIVGKHAGYPFYTIGQRKNIGAHKVKMYVTSIDSKNNTVHIGPDEELQHSGLIAAQVNWVGAAGIDGPVKARAKVRYKDDGADASLFPDQHGKIKVLFDQPKRAITPGQSVVVYDGDDVLCGGIIENVTD